METSLNGKALNFGFSDYGFESRVSNLLYNHAYSYLINHIKINSAKKKLSFMLPFTRKIFQLLLVIKTEGFVSRYVVYKNKNGKKLVKIYLLFYRLTSLAKSFKMLSTPSKFHFISYSALRMVNKKLSNTVFVISTPRGLMPHSLALQQKIGGLVVGYFFF